MYLYYFRIILNIDKSRLIVNIYTSDTWRHIKRLSSKHSASPRVVSRSFYMTPVLNNKRKLLRWSLVIEFLSGAREAEIFLYPIRQQDQIKQLQNRRLHGMRLMASHSLKAPNQIRAKQTNPHRT